MHYAPLIGCVHRIPDAEATKYNVTSHKYGSCFKRACLSHALLRRNLSIFQACCAN